MHPPFSYGRCTLLIDASAILLRPMGPGRTHHLIYNNIIFYLYLIYTLFSFIREKLHFILYFIYNFNSLFYTWFNSLLSGRMHPVNNCLRLSPTAAWLSIILNSLFSLYFYFIPYFTLLERYLFIIKFKLYTHFLLKI